MAAPVTSTGASLLVLPKPSLSSSTSQPPLPFFTRRPPPPVLRSHSSVSSGSSRFTTVRCCANRSAGDSFSPLTSFSKFRNPPSFDEESWLVVMDKPGWEGTTEQMVAYYVETLALVVGSEDEALKKIYRVVCEGKLGFGCVMDDDETLHKLRGLPGDLDVLPDPYVPPYKDSADTLKHFALNIKRFARYKEMAADKGKDGVKYGGSLAKWFKLVPDLLMEQVEEDIHAFSVAFKALDTDICSKMQSPVEQVLNELSVHVKQLCSMNKEEEKAMVMEQVKKAIESLSLAVNVVDSFHSDKGDVISLLAQALIELPERVMELWNRTTQEADGAAHGDSKEDEEAP